VVDAAQLYELPRHMLALEVERILTVDLTTARAQAKEATPASSHEGGQRPAFARASQNMAVAATHLYMPPTPSIDTVDRLYH
jgi:hypothetical protein